MPELECYVNSYFLFLFFLKTAKIVLGRRIGLDKQFLNQYITIKLSQSNHFHFEAVTDLKMYKINPYLTNGFSHRYQLGESTFYLIFR